ncbi:MAG: YtxH domain-containing protein [Ferruginibacter sp.]
MSSNKKVLAAVAAGIAAGAVLGVLFVPDKGTTTRKKISKKGEEITDDVKDKFNKGKNKFNDMKDKVGQIIKEKVEQYS